MVWVRIMEEKETLENENVQETSSNQNETEKIEEIMKSSDVEESTSSTEETVNSEDGKKKKKKNKRVKTIVISSVLSVFFLLAGTIGGYFLYNTLNPASNTITQALGDILSEKEKNEIKKSIENDSVLSSYQDKSHMLVNYSLELEADSKYSMILTKGVAKATAVMTVEQKIQSATLRTPECIFNENISSSSAVETANRYYDRKDNKIEAYECKNSSQWPSATSINYTYDEYIDKFGKLLSGRYYCIRDESKKTIKDKFLTLSEDEFKNSKEEKKYPINGILIYAIGKNTVKSSSIEKIDDGYKITLKLKSSGESYYSVQMKSTGGLATYPAFKEESNNLVFVIDKNLRLVSSVFEDSYDANLGFMSAPTSQILTQYYFHSDTDSFNGKQIKVPDMSNVQFDGYSLLPKEE